MSDAANSVELLEGKTITGSISARMLVDNTKYVNFAGCTYLALGDLPEIRNAAIDAVQSGQPFAMQLSPAYGAIDPAFGVVEQAGAKYCGTESAVYFASGYLIGLVGLAALEGVEGPLFIDEGAHFSLWDAARVSGRDLHMFAHCDPNALEAALKKGLKPGERPIVITDGAFATTGRVPPLSDYATLIASYDGRILIDEAHSFGVMGVHGRGAAEHMNVEEVVVSAGTLSKAFCAQGAIYAGDAKTVERLKMAPPLRGANGGSPISAAVAAAAMRYMMRNGTERRARLAMLTAHLRSGIRHLGIEVVATPAPIVAFSTGTRTQMQQLQRLCFDEGIYLMLSNYTGAGPHGMFRAAVYADHDKADIDALIDVIRRRC